MIMSALKNSQKSFLIFELGGLIFGGAEIDKCIEPVRCTVFSALVHLPTIAISS